MNTFLLKEWKNTFCHCWMWRRSLRREAGYPPVPPWSPPVYMKTNGERNNGGKLKPEYRKRWAEYICRYIEEYRSRGHLWHFTHFLKAGAQRIGVTRYTDKIEVTAFEKDGRITVVLLNRTEEEIPVYLRLGEYCAETERRNLWCRYVGCRRKYPYAHTNCDGGDRKIRKSI